MVDLYNTKGQLTRFSMRHLGFRKEIPGLGIVLDNFHDIVGKRYYIQGFKADGCYFSDKGLDKRFFSPKAMKGFIKQDVDALLLP